MALSFTRFPWLSLGGKEKEQIPTGSGISSVGEWGFGFRGEKLYSMNGGGGGEMPSSKKSKSREERSTRIDREYDVVLVPSDGVSLSGSESDDSDWSIGWMEPHAPDFQSGDEGDDGDGDDSFAVLVPCYRNDCKKIEVPSVRFLGGVNNLPNGNSAGGKEYMEQWLSSLQNFRA